MLEYCVQHTIEGDVEKLRERQLGIVLFSRPLSYDTSDDPIVRMAASEIRKRLAQFYDVAGDEARVRISLPPGSYVTEFRFLDSVTAVADLAPALHGETLLQQVLDTDFPDKVETAPHSAKPILPAALSCVAGLLLLTCILGYTLWSRKMEPAFWQGSLDGAGGQVVLVLGQLRVSDAAQPAEPDPPLQTDIFRASRFVSVGDASSAVAICATVARASLNCQLRPAVAVDLSGVRKRPVIFVGAYNNPWTLRVGAPLPYRFGPFACKCIVDAKSGRTIGVVDFSIPRDKISTDYSIVARFHSEVTDGPVVVIAGVGPMSTEAAAEFVSSAKGSEDLLRQAPKGWKGGNVEGVLGTDVVNGIPGHTRILQTAFW